MQALTERARQALGLGSDLFVASNLDAHEATLKDLANFAGPLKALEKATGQFNQDTAEFLQATAALMTSCPFPRMWAQPSPTEPAVPVHVPVPSDAAAWLDADTHELLAREVPGAVRMAVKSKLLAPMQQWLAAYDVAQAQLASLQSGRLAYDATRRRLVTAAARAAKDAESSTSSSSPTSPTAAAAAVAGSSEGGDVRPADVLLVSGGQQLAQLQELAAATSPELAEYEAKVEALDDTLTWLAGGAARIKAALADAGGSAAAAAETWQVPHGLLPPLQEKSTIGKDIDIMMTMTDSPCSAEAAAAQIASSIASTRTGDAAITLQPKHDSSSDTASHAGAEEQQHGSPDLSAMLPKDDAMVYGGGVPPSPTTASHFPTGGGPAQYIKDTLAGPAAAAEDEAAGGDGGSSSSSAVQGLPAANLSSVLPRDDAVVCGGGIAPSPTATAHHPTGGGPGQYIKDTLTGPAAAEDEPADTSTAAAAAAAAAAEPAADVSSAGSELSTDEQLADELALHQDARESAATAAADDDAVDDTEEGPAELLSAAAAAAAAAAAPEVVSRPSRSYSGEGVGQHEPGPAAAAAAAAARSGSGGLHVGRAYSGPGLAMQPGVKVADPERKQLSTVVLPASGEQALQAAAEAAAAHDMPFSGGEGAADASSSGSSTAAGSGNSSSAAAAGGGGGLLAAIARTVEEGGTHLKKLVGSALHGDHHHQQQQGEEEQQAEEFVDAEVPTESSESSGVKFEVQGADSAGAPGAPGTLCEGPSSSAAEEQQQQAAPGTDMHIGPVSPFPGHQAPPGSAEWVKGPTPPGGAAAAADDVAVEADNGLQEEKQHRLAAEAAAAGTGMHIGPVAPFPGPQAAPGSADWEKGPTPPGGAAAAGPTAPAAAAPAAEAPAGDDTAPTADSGSKQQQGPDLSAMLPSYEQLPAGGRKTKPSGGGVGALLRDTLLGPPADE